MSAVWRVTALLLPMTTGCVLGLDDSDLTSGEPSTCPVVGALCEGFEGELTAGVWRFAVGNQAASVEVERSAEEARRGVGSLTVATEAIGDELGDARGEIVADLPEDGADVTAVWVRLYALFPAAGNPTGENQARVLKIAQASAPLTGIQVLLEEDAINLHLGFTGNTRSVPWTMPEDGWFCLTTELQIAAEGSVRVSIDDEGVLDFEGDTRAPDGAPPYGAVTTGLAFLEPTVAQEAYAARFDEVLVATEPIDCAD